MTSAPLYDAITGLEMNRRTIVELEIRFPRKDDDVVHGVGGVHAGIVRFEGFCQSGYACPQGGELSFDLCLGRRRGVLIDGFQPKYPKPPAFGTKESMVTSGSTEESGTNGDESVHHSSFIEPAPKSTFRLGAPTDVKTDLPESS